MAKNKTNASTEGGAEPTVRKARVTREMKGLGVLLVPLALAKKVAAAADHFDLNTEAIGNSFAPELATLFGFGGGHLHNSDGSQVPSIQDRFEKQTDLFGAIDLTPATPAETEAVS